MSAKAYEINGIVYSDILADINIDKQVEDAILNGISLEFNYLFSLKENKWYSLSPYFYIKKKDSGRY